jgi:hypothetical protein
MTSCSDVTEIGMLLEKATTTQLLYVHGHNQPSRSKTVVKFKVELLRTVKDIAAAINLT